MKRAFVHANRIALDTLLFTREFYGLGFRLTVYALLAQHSRLSPVIAGLVIGLLTGLLIGLAESRMAGVVSVVSSTHAAKAPFVSRQ